MKIPNILLLKPEKTDWYANPEFGVIDWIKKIMMGNSNKIQFNEQIRERTLKMSVDVHDLFVLKKVSAITKPIVNQIIRSSKQEFIIPVSWL